MKNFQGLLANTELWDNSLLCRVNISGLHLVRQIFTQYRDTLVLAAIKQNPNGSANQYSDKLIVILPDLQQCRCRLVLTGTIFTCYSHKAIKPEKTTFAFKLANETK